MTEGTLRIAGGADLRYRIDGPPEGPALVLSNSLGTTLAMWDRQLPAFSGYFRVVRYDHRGHGGSSSPPGAYRIDDLGGDLVGLLDGLGIERAAVCGLSLGAMAAMWAAAHHPDRISALVLACTAPWLGPPEAWHERAAAVRAHGVRSLAPALHERWFPEQVRATQPRLLDEVTSMLAAASDDGYAACCEAIAGMDLRPDLGAIVAPTLVIGGASDPVTPPATELALAGALGAGLRILPGASHLANLAQPVDFADAVLDHLTGGSLARGMAVRRAVLGDAHVDRAVRRPGVVWPAFGDLISRYAWGEVWSRPGLDRRTRSAVAVALLVALGHHEELGFHVPAALNNGLTPEEVGEVVLQCAVYAGVPAANAAIPRVEEALAAATPTSTPAPAPAQAPAQTPARAPAPPPGGDDGPGPAADPSVS